MLKLVYLTDQNTMRQVEVNFSHFYEDIVITDKATGGVKLAQVPSATLCQIYTPGSKDNPGECLAEASVSVHHTDQFSYKTGRKLSFMRAVRAFTASRRERASIWRAFMTAGMPAGKLRRL